MVKRGLIKKMPSARRQNLVRGGRKKFGAFRQSKKGANVDDNEGNKNRDIFIYIIGNQIQVHDGPDGAFVNAEEAHHLDLRVVVRMLQRNRGWHGSG